jgi:hypothetical protein
MVLEPMHEVQKSGKDFTGFDGLPLNRYAFSAK